MGSRPSANKRWIASSLSLLAITSWFGAASGRERLHLLIEIRFAFKPDAGQIRHDDVAILDTDAVGETAIGLEQVGIALIAAETEAGRDVERHLMAAMRDA